MALRLMEQRVVTFYSVLLVRVMPFDVEHKTCGTFSPGVGLPTSACIDCGVHASCDAGHSTSCHLSASTGGVVHLSRLQRYSLQVVREDKHPVGSRLFRDQYLIFE